MEKLNKLEVQNIRHICGASSGYLDKITYYKTLTNDKKALDLLDKTANEFTTIKNGLSGLL